MSILAPIAALGGRAAAFAGGPVGVGLALASLAPLIYDFFRSDAPDQEQAAKIKEVRDKLAAERAGSKGISIEQATEEINTEIEPLIAKAKSGAGEGVASLIGAAGTIGLAGRMGSALKGAKAATSLADEATAGAKAATTRLSEYEGAMEGAASDIGTAKKAAYEALRRKPYEAKLYGRGGD